MLERLAEIDRIYIKSKVESGYYTSEIELVRDAIRRMREDDEKRQRIADLKSLFMAGYEQLSRGEVVPFSDNFMEESMQRALKNQQIAKSIKDEVKP